MTEFKLEKKERELRLLPSNDPRVMSAVAPWTDDLLKEHNFKDRKEVSDLMFKTMLRYGGIGLSANQVGLPFNMFVIGDHMSLEKGLKIPIVTTLHGTDITLVGKSPSVISAVNYAINKSSLVTAVSESLRLDTLKYFDQIYH